MSGLLAETGTGLTSSSVSCVKILLGNVMDRIRELPDESVHCVVTSPPYYCLRDYKIEPSVWAPVVYSPMAGLPEMPIPFHGDPEVFPSCDHEWGERKTYSTVRESTKYGKSRTTARFYGDDPTRRFDGNHQKHFDGSFCVRCGSWKGCLGNEPTPELFVGHVVQVFRKIRRVLRSDGTLWLNMGDTYSSGGMGGGGSFMKERRAWKEKINAKGWRSASPGLKNKDLIGIPWRVALALQSDGWILRSEIVWAKQNSMPESVKDRPTSSHEKIFLFSKSPTYFYDYEGAKEPAKAKDWHGMTSTGTYHAPGQKPQKRITDPAIRRDLGGPRQRQRESGQFVEYFTRNPRNVWFMSTQPFPEAHYATFPEELPRRAIMAGTPVHVCSKCGAPWNTGAEIQEPKYRSRNTGAEIQEPKYRSRSSCGCPENRSNAATVLDPFSGSGTTGLVAQSLGRHAVLIEASPENVEMARRRIRRANKLFSDVTIH